MSEAIIHTVYPVKSADYERAGEASADIKRKLKQLGVDSSILRRISVASYEVELNLVIHSMGGELTLEMSEEKITLISEDVGPGIPDLEKAMTAGWSTANEEARSLGFGAGMGLPNMKRNADEFEINSVVGEGTRIVMSFHIA